MLPFSFSVPEGLPVFEESLLDALSFVFVPSLPEESSYYKQVNTDKNLQLKSLRKTYLTYLNSAMSSDTKKLSSHTTDEILGKHYVYEKVVNKAIQEMEIGSFLKVVGVFV